MDDLLREFLTETNESLDVADVELVKFEQDPNNAQILNNIFRLVHTIKGTCGFIGLSRLAALAHAAETLMDKFPRRRAGDHGCGGLVLQTIDRIKELLAELEARGGSEPEGSDQDLIGSSNSWRRMPTTRRSRCRGAQARRACGVQRLLRSAGARSAAGRNPARRAGAHLPRDRGPRSRPPRRRKSRQRAGQGRPAGDCQEHRSGHHGSGVRSGRRCSGPGALHRGGAQARRG